MRGMSELFKLVEVWGDMFQAKETVYVVLKQERSWYKLKIKDVLKEEYNVICLKKWKRVDHTGL